MSKDSIKYSHMEHHTVDQNEHKESPEKFDATHDNSKIPADFWSDPLPESMMFKPARFHRLRKLLGLPEGKRRFNRAD